MFFMFLTRMLKISYQLDVIYYSIHKLIFYAWLQKLEFWTFDSWHSYWSLIFWKFCKYGGYKDIRRNDLLKSTPNETYIEWNCNYWLQPNFYFYFKMLYIWRLTFFPFFLRRKKTNIISQNRWTEQNKGGEVHSPSPWTNL